MAHTILCIDDDPFYIDFYTTLLTAKGFKVETSQSLAKGLELAVNAKPALITLDIMMPEQEGFFDGYGLMQELKRREETANIPIIMISALDQSGDIGRAEGEGADVYFPKQQMTPDSLVEKINELIGKG